jgi:bifunctional UDP-N-acetylglucosamine pyrophosphorylase/glucosamine-1-phosphate N-acetyltransferase
MTDAIQNPKSKIQNAPSAVILAAGKGKRMNSDLPKVLHEVGNRPMVAWVVDACREAGADRIIVVVGHGGQLVRDALTRDAVQREADLASLHFVEQTQQLGTGHAAQMAAPLFAEQPPCDTFVLAGDGPLIRGKTLARLLELHRRRGAAATLATAVIDDPSGYGRIVRDAAGEFSAIVEQKDATPLQLAIKEVNPSYYCFRSDALFAALGDVNNRNAAGEYYLTDVPAILKRAGQVVSVVDAVPPEDVLSINTPQQLSMVDTVLRRRLTLSGIGKETHGKASGKAAGETFGETSGKTSGGEGVRR